MKAEPAVFRGGTASLLNCIIQGPASDIEYLRTVCRVVSVNEHAERVIVM